MVLDSFQVCSLLSPSDSWTDTGAGLVTTMVCQGLTILVLGATTLHFSRQNRLLREGKRGPIENTPGFFYTL